MLSYIRGDKRHTSKSAPVRVNASMDAGSRAISLNGSVSRARNPPSLSKGIDDPAGITTTSPPAPVAAAAAVAAAGGGAATGEDNIEEGYEDIGRPEDHPNHVLSRKSSTALHPSSAHSRHSSGHSRLTAMSSKPDKDLEPALANVDANFKQGLQLIQQAYEDRHAVLLEEVQHWKMVAEEQSEQMETMAAALARVEANYASLQKEMSQLQMFRRAIVTMVDQHSGVALTELEQSILETIEANDDQRHGGDEPSVDLNADTSSFMLGSDMENSFRAKAGHHASAPIRISRPTKLDDSDSSRQPPLSSSVPKRSSMITHRRQRASTDVLARSSSVQDSATNKSRPPMGRGPVSPPNARLPPTFSSSNRSNHNLSQYGHSTGSKQASRMSSTEGLRSKRNTVSATTARPLYPNQTALSNNSNNNNNSSGSSQANTTVNNHSSNRRSSNASPLSPPLRATTSSAVNTSARLKSGSTSFSSTPSSSPHQGQLGTTAETTGANVPHTTAAIKAAQQQLQKEYHTRVKNLMSQQAGMSTHTAGPANAPQPTFSALSPDNTTLGPKVQNGGVTEDNYPTTQHYKLSPAAQELLKKQKIQQELNQEQVAAKRSQHLSTSTAGRYYQNEGEQGANPGTGGHGTSTRSHATYQHQQHSRSNVAQQNTSSYQHRHHQQQQQQEQEQQQSGGVDARAFTTLYKEIRDSMDVASFSQFAKVVTAFNEGEKSTEETLQEVSRIVKDRTLNKRFQGLILMAIADKERQDGDEDGRKGRENDEDGGGNVSMISANITIDPDDLNDDANNSFLPEQQQHESIHKQRDGGAEAQSRYIKANWTLGQNDIEDDLDYEAHRSARNVHDDLNEEDEDGEERIGAS